MFHDISFPVLKYSIPPTHGRNRYPERFGDFALTFSVLKHPEYRDTISYVGDLTGSQELLENSGEFLLILDSPECIGNKLE